MQRNAIFAAVVTIAIACAESQRDKPLSEAGEKLYPLRGTIEARDAGDNVLRVKHEAIPGFMQAMTMDFSVRGAEVTSLPPDGAQIDAQLHVTDNAYWLTDVKSR